MSVDVTETVVFDEHTIEVDGRTIRYLEAGSGPALVVLHGGGGLRCVRAHELLAERHRVMLLEMPGFGTSAADDDTPSVEEYAKTVHRAAAAIVGGSYNVMGTSFGGRVAAWIATQFEPEIETAVLSGPAIVMPDGFGLPVTPGALPLYAHPERHEPVVLDGDVAVKQLTLVRRLLTPSDPDLESALGSVSIPVLVAFGTEDQVMPASLGHRYLGLNPAFFLIFFYDAGHAVEVERPEALANLVASFVEHKFAYHVTRESSLIFP